MDGQAPQCNEEAGRGRRLGCRKGCTTMVGQTKRSVEDVTKKKARRSTQIVSLPVLEGGQKPHPRGIGHKKIRRDRDELHRTP